MKRKIGIGAMITAGVCLFLWIMIIVNRAGFAPGGGLNGFASTVLVTYFISMFTGIICLAGDFIRFIGRKFGEGFGSRAGTVYCTACGKPMNPNSIYCPACGTKTK